jgi:alginate O-acetyltransferase complex protein AlgI
MFSSSEPNAQRFIHGMQFNSIEFLLFFPTAAAVYYTLPHRYRWFLLVLASCVFYMAFVPEYIFILGITIAIDYSMGIAIERSEHGKKKYLLLSILATFLVLFFFKYFNFFNSNVAVIAKLIHWNYPVRALSIVVPIGLSFHKFQSLSYVIEVYRGRQKAERHFGIYALYVMFFPQLAAGPIERPYNMLPQYHAEHPFDYDQVTNGLKLMAWGLFKKVVIADRLALIVNLVFNSPGSYEGLPLLLATVFFAFQIYCDFSGYSDIAIGAAQVLGFRLMENFNVPYAAKSIPEFWSRWHISFSTWLRDYIFLPLSYSVSRRLPDRRIAGIPPDIAAYSVGTVITMLFAGLWHGANWTYVAWGGLFGIYLMASVWTRSLRKKFVRLSRIARVRHLRPALRVLFTFALVCCAWVLFRANSLDDARYVLTHMWTGTAAHLAYVGETVKQLLLHQNTVVLETPLKFNQQSFASVKTMLLAVAAIVAVIISDRIQMRGSVRAMLATRPAVVRWAAYYALIMAIILFGVFDNSEQFIYFRF